jgi:hypothetical protein
VVEDDFQSFSSEEINKPEIEEVCLMEYNTV